MNLNKNIVKRETCRLCGEGPLKEVIDFGEIYVSDFVESPNEGIKAPLTLVQCGNCELVQLLHTAPQELLYSRHYWYESGLNTRIVEDLKEIAGVVNNLTKPGDTVLDIGANDGTLLSYIDKGRYRVGCEPATNLVGKLKSNCDLLINDFWSIEKLALKARVITAIGMFYDMEDPNQFVRDAADALTEDGVFITQLMTLKPMYENNDLGNICHEHLEYYSYKTLVRLFETNGLEIYGVEENDINGGSYRLFARKYKTGSIGYPEPEFNPEVFKNNIIRNKEQVRLAVWSAIRDGKSVYGYGASTKGNTILQYYGLTTQEISGVVDPNPNKLGKLCVGSWVPVVGEEAIQKADYLLILPWGFRTAFILKERGKGYKGQFVIHTPNFEIA